MRFKKSKALLVATILAGSMTAIPVSAEDVKMPEITALSDGIIRPVRELSRSVYCGEFLPKLC